MSEKTFPVPLRSTVEGMQWLYNTATDNFIRELRDANAELVALRAEVERLEEKVRRIESACGLPDPAEACRVVLAIAAEEEMPPGWGCNKARNAFQSGRNHGPSGKPHAARVRAAEREERGKEKR